MIFKEKELLFLMKRNQEINENLTKNLNKIVKEERIINTRGLNISKGTVHTFLSSLDIRKLCSRFVPKLLTAEMQAHRLK